MKLYIYRGLDGENIPKDVTHVIIEEKLTIIKKEAFYECHLLISLIMSDNIKRVEDYAFCGCTALRFIRLSKMLEYIGEGAFCGCYSLEALFLPSTVKSIKSCVFCGCRSLRLLILSHAVDLNISGDVLPLGIISNTAIDQIAKSTGVAYELTVYGIGLTRESDRRVNEWLLHHMDEAPFHKLCYNLSITTKQINDYLTENGNNVAVAISTIHGMTPLHMLLMNPHAPAETIAALLDVNVEVAVYLDNPGRISLDYARDYNLGGLVGMIYVLCNHRRVA